MKPGPTIEEIYNNYGRGGYLTILYADKYVGMQGMLRMEKWILRLLFIIIFIWVGVYAYSFYASWGNSSSNQGSGGNIGNGRNIGNTEENMGMDFDIGYNGD